MRAGTQAPHTAAAPGAVLLRAVSVLRDEVATLPLPLAVDGAAQAVSERDGLVDQLDDYLLPRLRRLDAPLLAVVGGSTGAGKSTLVNSLVGRSVTTPGVLRPTTRQPVLVHSPEDAAWFTSDAVLPTLARSTGAEREARDQDSIRGLRLVVDDAQQPGLALVDAPDIDSVVDANRELALQLLGAADLWLFVTTAARYADAVPWEVLRTATERGTAVAVVLDRVPEPALAEIRADLAGMLTRAGMASAPLFTLVESVLEDGRLPAAQLAPLRRWLAGVGSDARSRDVVVRRTLTGALASLQVRVPRLADAADAQDAEVEALRADTGAAYAGATDALDAHLSDGTLLRGEVLARWQEFIGTGELFSSLQAGIGRLRDRVVAAVTGRAPSADRLGEALAGGVAALVLDAAGRAREDALLHWRARPAGAALLAAVAAEHPAAADPRLREGLGEDVERLVRDWQGHVLDLVRREGEGKRSRALVYSLGVSGAGAVLMFVVFAASAGLTGAEVGIAAATAALAQRVLEAAFGDQAVRTLAAAARRDLVERVQQLLDGERDDVAGLLPAGGVGDGEGAGERLRAAAAQVAAAGATAGQQPDEEQPTGEQPAEPPAGADAGAGAAA